MPFLPRSGDLPVVCVSWLYPASLLSSPSRPSASPLHYCHLSHHTKNQENLSTHTRGIRGLVILIRSNSSNSSHASSKPALLSFVFDEETFGLCAVSRYANSAQSRTITINPAFFEVTAPNPYNSWCEPNFQTGRPFSIAATGRSVDRIADDSWSTKEDEESKTRRVQYM